MSESEAKVKIYTENEKVKRTILNAIQEETGMKLIIPKGAFELQECIYDEKVVRIIQAIILSNQLSLVTIKPISKVEEQEESRETTVNEQESVQPKRKHAGGRKNNTLDNMISYIKRKKEVTRQELIKNLNICPATASRNLKILVEDKGIIVCTERGKWRLKDFYRDDLDLPQYNSIVDYIVGKSTVSINKMAENFPKENVEYVLKELEASNYIQKLDESTYKIDITFRVWYHIRKNPHIQWATLKVYMTQHLVDSQTLSNALNKLRGEKKVKSDGEKGYVIV